MFYQWGIISSFGIERFVVLRYQCVTIIDSSSSQFLSSTCGFG